MTFRTLDEIAFTKNYSSLEEAVRDLVSDLDLDAESVMKIITGLGNTSIPVICTNLSHNVNSSDLHMLAGRLYVWYKIRGMTYSKYIDLAKLSCSEEYCAFLEANRRAICEKIESLSWVNLTYNHFAARTIFKTYCLSSDPLNEPPVMMWLRSAFSATIPAGRSLEECFSTLHSLCEGLFTPGSTVTFNACKRKNTLFSCYMINGGNTLEDMCEGIKEASLCMGSGGGVSVCLTDVPHSREESASCVKSYMKILSAARDNITQSGSRPASVSVQIASWHIDVELVIAALTFKGNPANHIHNLNYAIMVNDLFYKRARGSGQWTLFCPSAVPELKGLWGEKFEEKYEHYEALARDGLIPDNKFKVVHARDLDDAIVDVMKERGKLSLLSLEALNRTTPQMNIGPICQSNLCMEMAQVTSPGSPAVCVIGSVCLPVCVRAKIDPSLENSRDISTLHRELRRVFDFTKFAKASRELTRFLDSLIDISKYPSSGTEETMKFARPIGNGVVGEGDALQKMDIPQGTAIAKEFSRLYSACLFYESMRESSKIAQEKEPCGAFLGSPASQGLLHPDMWKQHNPSLYRETGPADWGDSSYTVEQLRSQVREHGVRNSLLVAYMPTATSSQVRGHSETTEPRMSNLFTREVLHSTYLVSNYILEKRLRDLGVWDDNTVRYIMNNRGSVSGLASHLQGRVDPALSPHLERVESVFKTIWEVRNRDRLECTAIRAAYVDQSQSSNLYDKRGTRQDIKALILAGNYLGLKTIAYYTTIKPSGGDKFTADEWDTIPENKGSAENGNRLKLIEPEIEVPTVCRLGGDCQSCQG